MTADDGAKNTRMMDQESTGKTKMNRIGNVTMTNGTATTAPMTIVPLSIWERDRVRVRSMKGLGFDE